MTQELCRDVRNLILEKMTTSEDMMLVVISEKEPFNVMFYVSRNMRDPEHYVWFTIHESIIKKETTYLLRTKEALRMMIEHAFDSIVMDVVSIYVQGETRPKSMQIDWRMKRSADRFNAEMYSYVVSHMPCYHTIYNDDISDPNWRFPSYVGDIFNRVLTLVSTA